MNTSKMAKLALVATLSGVSIGFVLAQPGTGNVWQICLDECTPYFGCPMGYGQLAALREPCYTADLTGTESTQCREGRWNLYYCESNLENQGVGNKYVTYDWQGSYCIPYEGGNCNGGA